MSDIRIISYLPNPRVYKATIVARHSGAVIDVIGDKPPEMANWLWDYQAIKMSDADKQAHASAWNLAIIKAAAVQWNILHSCGIQ